MGISNATNKITPSAPHQSWSKEESDFILDRLESAPIRIIAETRDRIAERKGWPARSRNSVAAKAKRLAQKHNLNVTPTVDGWTAQGLGDLLGFSRPKVAKWRQKGLRISGHGQKYNCIRRADLIPWARLHLEEFGGADEMGLLLVFEDNEELIEAISELPRKGPGPKKRPVRRLETGEEFLSVVAAARACFLSERSITQAINTGGKAGGSRWEDA